MGGIDIDAIDDPVEETVLAEDLTGVDPAVRNKEYVVARGQNEGGDRDV